MSSYGTQSLEESGRDVGISADGRPDWKTGGITVDWTKVSAATADLILSDGTPIKTGEKYLEMGEQMARISATGKFAAADTTATDGRQTPARGNLFLLNRTVKQSSLGSDHPAVIQGGNVYKARVKVGGNRFTLAQVEQAIPTLTYTQH